MHALPGRISGPAMRPGAQTRSLEHHTGCSKFPSAPASATIELEAGSQALTAKHAPSTRITPLTRPGTPEFEHETGHGTSTTGTPSTRKRLKVPRLSDEDRSGTHEKNGTPQGSESDGRGRCGAAQRGPRADRPASRSTVAGAPPQRARSTESRCGPGRRHRDRAPESP